MSTKDTSWSRYDTFFDTQFGLPAVFELPRAASYHTRHSATLSSDTTRPNTMVRSTQLKAACQHITQLKSGGVLWSTRKTLPLDQTHKPRF